jgi:hypothetical protein
MPMGHVTRATEEGAGLLMGHAADLRGHARGGFVVMVPGRP